MREILFRGKAINRNKFREYRTNYKNGDWVYGLISKPYCECFPSIPPEMTNTNGISGIDVDYTTIGQYTGLTDKNGIRIFEGDVVEFQFDKDDCSFSDKDTKKRIGRVYFEEFRASFAIAMGRNGSSVINNDLFKYVQNGNRVSVIGNIHDNPELLGDDEQ